MGGFQPTSYSGLDILERTIRKMSGTPSWDMPGLYFLRPLKTVILNTMSEGIKLFSCVVVNSSFTELCTDIKTRRIKISLYVAAPCRTPNANTWPQDTLHKTIIASPFSTLWGLQVSPVPTLLRKSWTYQQMTEIIRNYYEYDENYKIYSVPDTSLLLSHSLF